MLDVCHGDELCGVRCKVGMLILINGTQASLHPELFVTEGQMGNRGESRKDSTSIVILQRVKLDYCKIQYVG